MLVSVACPRESFLASTCWSRVVMQTFCSTIHPNEPLTPYKKHFKFRVSTRRSSEQVHRLGRLNFKGGWQNLLPWCLLRKWQSSQSWQLQGNVKNKKHAPWGRDRGKGGWAHRWGFQLESHHGVLRCPWIRVMWVHCIFGKDKTTISKGFLEKAAVWL